ncbi:Hypothetical protein R9X50_00014300 [Acrodontium crateriforme]|uniref:NTF2-like domain-containing protein n=1 Tax=Acrodontium crateriforme TaxID=150365 RepID=A0AAQ3LWR9_9PEZI|nr:Hypothetical protein R9X50_00014300 [Acrodontium crateriforme]
MHFATILLSSILATAVFATPTPTNWNDNNWKWGSWGRNHRNQCLTKNQGQQGAEIFRQLIQEYSTQLALEALTEDFVDYTSAVAIIINKGAGGPKSLTAPTFNGRAAFMAAQGKQPQIPFETLNVFHGCDSISVRWMTKRSAKGQATETAELGLEKYTILRQEFMAVVQDEEKSLHGHAAVKSELINKGWRNGGFWFFTALTSPGGCFNLFQGNIRPMFVQDLNMDQLGERLGPFRCRNGPQLVEKKLVDKEKYEAQVKEVFAKPFEDEDD